MKTDDSKSGSGSIDVAYVARLARLFLSDEETGRLQAQLSDILRYVDQLRQLDVEGIEPTAHAMAVQNVFRKDEPRAGLDRAAVLANAPATGEDLFLVPKIME